MSTGLLFIGLGILLCMVALAVTVLIIITARKSKKRILEKMEKKY